MAVVNFTGRWKEGESDKKYEFCLAHGLPEEMAKQFGDMKCVLEIVQDGDKFHTKELTPDGKVIVDEDLTVGVPFKPKELPPGVEEKEYIYRWEEDGKVLKSTGVVANPNEWNAYRFDNKGDLLVVCQMKDVLCTIHYTKE